jgi:hypothetical protein
MGVGGSGCTRPALTIVAHDGEVSRLDHLPEVLVFLPRDEDDAGRLHVERRGGVLDGMLDDRLELLVGDGRGVADGSVGPSGLVWSAFPSCPCRV